MKHQSITISCLLSTNLALCKTRPWSLNLGSNLVICTQSLKCNGHHLILTAYRNEQEYDLELKFDHNCPGVYSQWFYFKVSNTRRKQVYKFNIVNMVKGDSLFSHGMRPLLYSKKEAEFQNNGWQRFGSDITYMPHKKKLDYFALSFTTTFKFENDSVYIAACYPYTYSDGQHFISKLVKQTPKNIIKRTHLCKSLAGNEMDLLLITNFESTEEEIAARKAIVLTARVHPGETNSSYIM